MELVRRFDPAGWKWTLLNRIVDPGTVQMHELSRAIDSGKNVSDHNSREHEKKSDDVRSGILTEMCPVHIKTHIHLILTR